MMGYSLINNFKNHKDFYGKGHYHKQIYKGNELIWEKEQDDNYSPEMLPLFYCKSIPSLFDLSQLDDGKYLFVLGTLNGSASNYAYDIDKEALKESTDGYPAISTNISLDYFIDAGIVVTTDLTNLWNINILSIDSNLNVNLISNVEVIGNKDVSFYGGLGCILDNGMRFVGARKFNSSIPRAYACLDCDTNKYYVVDQISNVTGMQYVYSNFATNSEKNRLWGMCHKGTPNASVLDYYAISIVEFDYPIDISTVDNLVVKDVLFETNDYYNMNQTITNSPFVASTCFNEMWFANNKMFARFVNDSNYYSDKWAEQPDEKIKFVCIDVDTKECYENNFVSTYPYNESNSIPNIAIKGVHYHNSTYYVFSTNYSIGKLVISTSKNLTRWKHYVTDLSYQNADNGTTTEGTKIVFDGGIAYVYVTNYALPSGQQYAIHKIIL